MRRPLRFALPLAIAATACAQPADPVYAFSTLQLFTTTPPAPGGGAASAQLSTPIGIVADAGGNLYVTEATAHTVRKISPNGLITPVAGLTYEAGTADGTGTAARFGTPSATSGSVINSGPFGIAIDKAGNLYVSDTTNHTIRRITPGGTVTTLAGIPGQPGSPELTAGRFHQPLGLAADDDGNVFVADCFNHLIRRIAPNGDVTSISGYPRFPGADNGTGVNALYFYPDGIALDQTGNLIVTDANYLVRRLVRSTANGVTTWASSTLAGATRTPGATDGTGADARFGAPNASGPTVTTFLWATNEIGAPPGTLGGGSVIGGLGGLAVDADGNILVADTMNHTIRRITPAGVVSTVGGAAGQSGRVDATGRDARFNRPKGIALDRVGNLYVVDSSNSVIRKGTLVIPPRITTPPRSQTIGAGRTLTLSASVAGNPPPALQWHLNGDPLGGATKDTLMIENVQAVHAGDYTLRATNQFGSVTSAVARITVEAPPAFTFTQVNQRLLSGESITLQVAVSSPGASVLQWHRDGVVLPGATQNTFTIPAAQAGDAGVYTLSATNLAGTTTVTVAILTIDTSRLVNLSIRASLGVGGTLIAGFVVAGDGKPLLARGIGPALGAFGIADALPDPRLSFHAGGTQLASNDNWGDAANATLIGTLAAQVGAFPLTAGARDAALAPTVSGGNYSIVITGTPGTAGTVLAELYDANPVTAARLVNVSARARAGSDSASLIAGFVITGNSRRTVLVRAIGPSLAAFGVANALPDPRLDLIANGSAAPLLSNQGWGGNAALAASFARIGAFPLAANSRDAAALAILEPGSYSARISSSSGATGEALIEIYELP